MNSLHSSSRRQWNNHFRYWWILAMTLISCLLIAGCNCNGVGNCNNTNSSSTSNTSSLTSVSTLPPTPSPTPSPTPTPAPKTYKADWSKGADGWVLSDGWSSVNGMLVNDGQDYDNDGHPTATAPLFRQDVSNYSVQVDIRLDRYTDEGGISGLAYWGIVVRWSQEKYGGYKVGACASAGIYSCGNTDHALLLADGSFLQGTPVGQAPFRPAYGIWHTYRIDVQGTTITVWVDGGKIFQANDNKYLAAGNVGLWSYRSQISVRNLTINTL